MYGVNQKSQESLLTFLKLCDILILLNCISEHSHSEEGLRCLLISSLYLKPNMNT